MIAGRRPRGPAAAPLRSSTLTRVGETCRACDRGSSCGASGRSCGTPSLPTESSSSSEQAHFEALRSRAEVEIDEPRAEHHVDLADVRQADHRVEVADVDARVGFLERLAHRARRHASRRSRESPRAASTSPCRGSIARRHSSTWSSPFGQAADDDLRILVVDRSARRADVARQRCRPRERGTRCGRNRRRCRTGWPRRDRRRGTARHVDALAFSCAARKRRERVVGDRRACGRRRHRCARSRCRTSRSD